ncbi:hypothetical protein PH210_14905 [Paenibacillus sp. BSR1-1]|uniref:hypothetical protein n=1 Tax=Paenibacillus sp. BSR1-1 TaxID=3020845 RepID=UPI0025B1C7C6|nr:hypothetical protein [Paenibacillus sp. BSR1-1]MDN3017485.1 hypothetical protein [Paenibacillus sp. BSR1-1]
MYWITRLAVLMLALTMLSSCNRTLGCPDGAIEWVDLLMISNVKYQHHFPEPADEEIHLQIEKGRPLGEIKFKMADKACSDHKMKNGDAAYVEEGTTIYAVKGYPASLMVLANDKVYIAEENKSAKTLGDLYPINDHVKNIHIESTGDGRRIHTFSPGVKELFLNEWMKLKIEDYNVLQQKNAFEGEPTFLEIELNNGVSFRHLYWPNSNAFGQNALGNKTLQDLMMHELASAGE